MASGKIKDPNPPKLSANGFSFKTNDYINILRIGVLECDDCSTGENIVEHIYFDNLDGNFSKYDEVKGVGKVTFDHADFADSDNIQTRLAVNLTRK